VLQFVTINVPPEQHPQVQLHSEHRNVKNTRDVMTEKIQHPRKR